jgi:F0F1-type ATP synthase epsilon subunit
MRIKIISPDRKLYEGECVSVYVTTELGDAEILEKHAEFVAIIKGKIRIREKQKGEKIEEEKVGVKKEEEEIDLGSRKALFYTNGKEINIFVI